MDCKGHVTNEEMEEAVKAIYDRFNGKRKIYEAQRADDEDMRLLEEAAKYGQNRIDQ